MLGSTTVWPGGGETPSSDSEHQHQVTIGVAGIFNTGPDMNPEEGCIVSSFIVQVFKNEPIAFHG